MEYTTNYQLPTWVETDRIQMDDFNDMTEKLDAALREQAAALATAGNCQVYTTSYVGTGAYGKNDPSALTFDFAPTMVMIFGSGGIGLTSAYISALFIIQAGGSDSCFTTWSDDKRTISWYSNGGAADQLNSSGQTYTVTVWTEC